MSRNKKSQLQRLLFVQPRVAVCSVVEAQILVYETLTSTSTLCDCIAGQFKVHATKERAVLLVNLECRR